MNVIDENNKTNLVTQGATTTVLSAYFHTAYVSMVPWFLAAIPLIILDLNYGRKRAKMRKETVTINKSVRMTLDKTLSYICWIMLSTTLSMAFGYDWIKFVIMAIIYGLEVLSVIRAYLFCKGIIVKDAVLIRTFLKYIWYRLTGQKEDFKDLIPDNTKMKDDNYGENGTEKVH